MKNIGTTPTHIIVKADQVFGLRWRQYLASFFLINQMAPIDYPLSLS